MKAVLYIVLALCFLISGQGCSSSPTTPDVKNPPTIEGFTASIGTIHRGDSTTLSWSVKNATTVSIDQGIGPVSASGSQQVTPQATTTYILTASNADGQRSATCTISVELQLPTITSFTASPASINLGNDSILTWDVQDATSISIDMGVGTVAAVGSCTVSPRSTTTYTLTANNADGSRTATCIINVNTDVAYVTMSAGPTYATEGTIFQASGTLRNTGGRTAFNVRVTLYFRYKSAWGGGIYREYSWDVGNLGTSEYEDPFDWVIQWTGQEGWDMNRYVDLNSREYKITWQ